MPSTLSSSEHAQATKAARAATAVFFLNGLCIGSWIPRLAELRDTLGITKDILGRSLMGMGLGGLLGSVVAGLLATRTSTRTLTTVSGTLLMALLPLVAFGANAWALFGALFAIGTVDAMVDIGMNAQVVHAHDRLGRSSINRVHAVWSVGTLVGGLLGTGAAWIGVGLRPQLLLSAAFGLACMAWAAPQLLPFDAEPDTQTPGSNQSFAIGALLLGLVAAATAVLEGSSAEWSPLMLADERGASIEQAGLGFVVFNAAMLLSRLVADRVIESTTTRIVMVAGSALCLAGIASVVFAPTVALTLAGYAAIGIGVAPLFPLLYESAARSASAGTGLAVMSTGMRVGFLSAPVIIGTITAATNLRLAFGAIAGTAAAISLANALRK